ncbi:peptide-methionine (S)-S-oxide reductase MsrA [Clostridium grantii]|uniref:Peptide methionine sulfoxide reductase MsrA n=1 Tax=Clostridium grantii DSM 8605 TaxID=1121316 RepID=A0A1M5UIC2_9CLOT|nr:peptide-methionine (S)-S-oxide reductase MsrA [Clostridium grantii]SHH62403.1 peptide-methionine (S)-S-oxide reductase [Clostridium grantii DSM 8605]
MREIVLAGGCFWGVEAYFETLDGVAQTKVGYANGNFENPTYEMVCEQETGYAEACYIKYDSKIISLEKLLEAYWIIVDPTVKDRQGPDEGTQYRTGIYYYSDDDLSIILSSRDKEQLKYDRPIVTEIESLQNFFDAEIYHQKYLEKNPNGYCHIPRELLKKH